MDYPTEREVLSIIDEIICAAVNSKENKSPDPRKRKRVSAAPTLKQTKFKEDCDTKKIRRKARKLSQSKGKSLPKTQQKTKAIESWWSKCTKNKKDTQQTSQAPHQSRDSDSTEHANSVKNIITYSEFCQHLEESDSTTLSTSAYTTPDNTSEEDAFLYQLHQQLSHHQMEAEATDQNKSEHSACNIATDDFNTATSSFDMEVEDINNPKVLSLEVVMAMFNDLKIQVDNSNKGVSELRSEIASTSKSLTQAIISKVENNIQSHLNNMKLQQDKKIEKLEDELRNQKQVNQILINTLDEVHKNYTDIEQRIENLELGAARNCVMISNFECGLKKWECIRDLYEMFSSFLNVEVLIDDVFPIGNQTPANLVVVFQSGEDKRAIFRAKKLLKNYVTSNGKPCYINDYIPTATTEKRRRQNDIVTTNQEKKEEDRLDIQYAAGGIKIQNSTYVKKVSPPTPKEILDAATNRCAQIMQLKISSGSEITKNNNRFVGFVADANSHRDIRDLYV